MAILFLYLKHAAVFAYERKDNEQHFVVLNNFSSEPQALELPKHIANCSVECLISNLEPTTQLGSELILAPYQSLVLAL